MRFWLFACGMFVSIGAWAKPVFLTEFTDSISNRFRTQSYFASAALQNERGEIGVDFFGLRRDYTGAEFSEDGFRLRGVRPFEGGYLSAGLAHVPDPVTLARWSAFVEPRWAFSQGEWGFMVSGAEYEKLSVGTLKPVLTLWPEGPWRVDAASAVVFASRALGSSQARISRLWSNFSVSLSGAAGETLEDADLITHFQQVGLGTQWKQESWEIGVTANRYWSTTREENAVSLNLGIRP